MNWPASLTEGRLGGVHRASRGDADVRSRARGGTVKMGDVRSARGFTPGAALELATLRIRRVLLARVAARRWRCSRSEPRTTGRRHCGSWTRSSPPRRGGPRDADRMRTSRPGPSNAPGSVAPVILRTATAAVVGTGKTAASPCGAQQDVGVPALAMGYGDVRGKRRRAGAARAARAECGDGESRVLAAADALAAGGPLRANEDRSHRACAMNSRSRA